MKAEERKELETNVLADRVGKMVQKMKSGPSRRTVTWIVVILIAAAAVFLYFRNRSLREGERQKGWQYLAMTRVVDPREQGELMGLVLKSHGKEKSGLVAKVNLYYVNLARVQQSFPSDPFRALLTLAEFSQLYEELKKECKDDPLLLPEVTYHQGVIYEYRSILDSGVGGLGGGFAKAWAHLDPDGVRGSATFLGRAKEIYEGLAASHPDSAYGKKASKKLEELDDPARQKERETLYVEWRAQISQRISGFERELEKSKKDNDEIE
jgi:hypothetical protein